MFVRKSTHDAIVAAKNAEIGRKDADISRLGQRINQMLANMNEDDGEIARLQQKLRMSERRYEVLEARLAVFTAPRQRDAKGHFLPTSRKFTRSAGGAL